MTRPPLAALRHLQLHPPTPFHLDYSGDRCYPCALLFHWPTGVDTYNFFTLVGPQLVKSASSPPLNSVQVLDLAVYE